MKALKTFIYSLDERFFMFLIDLILKQSYCHNVKLKTN